MTRTVKLSSLLVAALMLPGCYAHHTADEEVFSPVADGTSSDGGVGKDGNLSSRDFRESSCDAHPVSIRAATKLLKHTGL